MRWNCCASRARPGRSTWRDRHDLDVEHEALAGDLEVDVLLTDHERRHRRAWRGVEFRGHDRVVAVSVRCPASPRGDRRVAPGRDHRRGRLSDPRQPARPCSMARQSALLELDEERSVPRIAPGCAPVRHRPQLENVRLRQRGQGSPVGRARRFGARRLTQLGRPSVTLRLTGWSEGTTRYRDNGPDDRPGPEPIRHLREWSTRRERERTMAVPKKKTSKMKTRSRRASAWTLKAPSAQRLPQVQRSQDAARRVRFVWLVPRPVRHRRQLIPVS